VAPPANYGNRRYVVVAQHIGIAGCGRASPEETVGSAREGARTYMVTARTERGQRDRDCCR
jgi:hypothetical protein